MVRYDVTIAGFGGQGVLLSGGVLASAGMIEGLNVTWFPSYGAEMRGGTANCTVILSDREIGSPITERPQALVAMNEPSAVKFCPRIRRGGVMVLNSSLITGSYKRNGVRALNVPGNDIAAQLGDPRVLNMVMLGAYAGVTGAVGLKSLEKALGENLPEHRKSLLEINCRALRRGYEVALGKS